MNGKVTLGLYNCYDAKQWHDIMRITLARAAPVALAFECDVATFGFPFLQARRRGAKETDGLRRPEDVARFVADGTSIGEGGEAFVDLVAHGRFGMHTFPEADGFPAGLGHLVVTTQAPDAAKAVSPLQVGRDLVAGLDQLVLFGLGPRGLPAHVLAQAEHHLEITGRGIGLETATALGALPAMLAAHRMHLGGTAR
jgi:hypothetical protein